MTSERTNLIPSDNTSFSIPNHNEISCASAAPEAASSLQSIAAAPGEAVSRYITAATADSTRRAYTSDLADFQRFGGRVPSDAAFVATYISFRAEQLSPHTLTRRVVAISRAHRALGLSDPCKTDLVRTVLRGVRRTKHTRQRQAVAIMPEDLFAMLPQLTGIKGARDKALLTLAFAAALRRSEIVSLCLDDLDFVKEGLVITLRSGKTDQEGKGRLIAIPQGRTAACAVRAVAKWIDTAGITTGAVFRQVHKNGQIGDRALTAQSVSSIVKERTAALGLPSANYSGHSLRAGFVTSAARAGASAQAIMRQTGHRSVEMVSRYIRNATMFDDNAATLLL